jgi:diguanylate cyclase (GGDEF)-like protein
MLASLAPSWAPPAAAGLLVGLAVGALVARRARGQVAGADSGRATLPPEPEAAGGAAQRGPVPMSPDLLASLDRAELTSAVAALGVELRDIRDAAGADEAVFWRWVASRDALTPAAWSTDGAARPQHFDMEAWGPLAQWSAEERIVHCDGEGAGSPSFAAAPIELDGRLYGVLTLSSRTGLGLPRAALVGWLPRYARRLSSLLGLLEVRRDFARQGRQAQALLQAAGEMHAPESFEALSRSLCATALQVTSASSALLARWSSDHERGEVLHAEGEGVIELPFALAEGSFAATACRDGLPLVMEDATSRGPGARLFGAGDGFDRLGSLAVVPLGAETAPIGALVIASPRPGAVSHDDARNLRLLGAVATTSLQIVWEIEEVTRRARTDGLTGLSNRRHFDEELQRILVQTDRFGGASSLVLVDIDHFKRVNDEFGHEAGDAVLRAVARTLADGVRTVDVCARYGGEELALLLPQTGIGGAVELADRLRRALERRVVQFGGNEIRVTASFGVASYPESVRSRDGLVQAADSALYEAKRSGRNCVRSAHSSAGRAAT